jgi:hypothetical protein
VDVPFEILAPRECPGTLEHEVDTQLLPRQVPGLPPVQRPHPAAGDHEIAVLDGHGPLIASIHRVEAQQIPEVLGSDQVIDRDQLEGRLVGHGLQDRAADAPQTVDGDPGAHAAPMRISRSRSEWFGSSQSIASSTVSRACLEGAIASIPRGAARRNRTRSRRGDRPRTTVAEGPDANQ